MSGAGRGGYFFLSCIAGKHFGLPVSGATVAHICILACVLDLLKEKNNLLLDCQPSIRCQGVITV